MTLSTAQLERIRGRLEGAAVQDHDPLTYWRANYMLDVGELLAVVAPVDPAPPAPEEPGEERAWTARDGAQELAALIEQAEIRLEVACDGSREAPSALERDQLGESLRHLRNALACMRRAAGDGDE